MTTKTTTTLLLTLFTVLSLSTAAHASPNPQVCGAVGSMAGHIQSLRLDGTTPTLDTHLALIEQMAAKQLADGRGTPARIEQFRRTSIAIAGYVFSLTEHHSQKEANNSATRACLIGVLDPMQR